MLYIINKVYFKEFITPIAIDTLQDINMLIPVQIPVQNLFQGIEDWCKLSTLY